MIKLKNILREEKIEEASITDIKKLFKQSNISWALVPAIATVVGHLISNPTLLSTFMKLFKLESKQLNNSKRHGR